MDEHKATEEKAELGHLIAKIAGGAVLILLVLFFVLFLVKSAKVRKIRKHYDGQDALLSEQKKKIATLEKNLGEQAEQFKKDVDTLKASSEQEKKNLQMKGILSERQ